MLAVPGLVACVSHSDWRETIAENQFEHSWVAGYGFSHLVVDNGHDMVDGRLHVYIEGDGTPWIGRTEISADPTPGHALMLEAMALDEAAAVYIGRPCYFGRHSDPGCGPPVWTFERYSEAVVRSMCAVAQRIAQNKNALEIILFGHSGGGTIAVLMMACTPSVRIVTTVAAPLDTSAWANAHEYTPLYGSLNPATQPLRRQAEELHLTGGEDIVTPPGTNEGYFQTRPWTRTMQVPDAGHIDCWVALWPRVLLRVAQLSAGTDELEPLTCDSVQDSILEPSASRTGAQGLGPTIHFLLLKKPSTIFG